MNRGFEASFRRHLALEQRRAVLDALADKIDPGTTIGQIVDIATALGWGDGVGGLSLADLADALLTGDASDAAVATEADDDVVEPAEPAPRGRKGKPAAPAKNARVAKGKGRARAPIEPEPEDEPAPAKAGRTKPAGKAKAPKGGKVAIDERMSLQEAADVFLPLVRQLGKATMQDIEDATSGGRRKLRFHIGQLVKHGHLERHGMGRGTYYTVA